jgi:aromatic ring-cleaving dioxygenase
VVLFMKRFASFLLVTLMLASPTAVFAVAGQSSEVQNQNQTSTQNQGDDQQIQTQTQEQESLQATSSANQNQTAEQNRTQVHERFQALLQIQTSGSVGDQIKTQARAQIQNQEQIEEQLNKVEARKGVIKFLIGPHYPGLENLKEQLEQNQLRVVQLNSLQTQVQNQGDKTAIQEAIQALNRENTSLQDKINEQEKSFSLLGWLFSLFAR